MSGLVWRFVLHYAEMVLAMAAGMLLLYPVLDLALGSVSSRVEVDSLGMATSMSLAMAAWMWFRRHRARPIVEMSLAMYAGHVVLFPFLWTGHLAADGRDEGWPCADAAVHARGDARPPHRVRHCPPPR